MGKEYEVEVSKVIKKRYEVKVIAEDEESARTIAITKCSISEDDFKDMVEDIVVNKIAEIAIIRDVLLPKLYKEIGLKLISETDTVKMEDIRRVIVDNGASESLLDEEEIDKPPIG